MHRRRSSAAASLYHTSLIVTNCFFSAFTPTALFEAAHRLWTQPNIVSSNCMRKTWMRFILLGVFFLFSSLPIANSCQNNQSKKFGLLSQLALSSQTKFFLKSPPKSRKKAGAVLQAAGSSDADLAAELEAEADTNETLSPIGQYDNCLSAGLDCAISELAKLDSQAEVEQGIFLMEGTSEINVKLQVFSVCCSVLCPKSKNVCFGCSCRKPLFSSLLGYFQNWIQKESNRFH